MLERRFQSGIATDSVVLTFVKGVTLFVSILQTMILSRYLSVTDYGTYSEGVLIISFFAPFFSLGLNDSINYFYNKGSNNIKTNYLNTIFLLSIIVGLFGGLVLVFFRDGLANFYSNPQITGIVIFVAFRPLLQNLVALYQPIYVSIGKTKVIAFRNLLISLAQVFIVGIFVFANISNLVLLFVALFVMDISQIMLFDLYLRKIGISISPHRADKYMIKEILGFAIPMFLSASIGTISINIDKLMISNLLTVEDYALYANVSKQLPFSFFVASLTAVVTPVIVKLLDANNLEQFRSIWSSYLELGYISTWILCFFAVLFSPEIIDVLYSVKYLTHDGIIIFRLYTVATMVGFTYFGLIPTALGNTRIVLRYSILNMILNIFLNLVLFRYMGILGPAYATIVSMFIPAILYFYNSLRLTKTSFRNVVKIKRIVVLIIEMAFVGVLSKYIVDIFAKDGSSVLRLFVALIIYIPIIIGLQYKNVKKLFHELNFAKE